MPAMTRLRRTELLLARESPGRTPGEQTGSCRSPWDLFIHLCLESELRESPGTKLGTDSSDSEQVLDTRRACGPPAPAGPLPELHGHEGGEEAGRPQGASQPLWRHQPSQALSVWTGFLPFPGPRHHGPRSIQVGLFREAGPWNSYCYVCVALPRAAVLPFESLSMHTNHLGDVPGGSEVKNPPASPGHTETRCEDWFSPETCSRAHTCRDWASPAPPKGVFRTYPCLPQNWAWGSTPTTTKRRNRPAT
ncbi:uncharacterized protein LOC133232973 isoform X1 [Bos javanicus]|uniref:uncharacterized protein LOC133232973 isoform X1 n=1 Tax=Bos javanicus TaxID=9906 RepID=UPI002AA6918A|nr:uncharacterized protein LOC133232973 isoform X1 [Bos javanicus]